MAAGLSLQLAHYEEFCQAFDTELRAQLKLEDLHQQIFTDGELQAQDFKLELAELLGQGGPWGQGFSEPLFDGCFDVVDQRLVGQRHLKMLLALPVQGSMQRGQGPALVLDAIAFNIKPEEWPNPRCQKVRVAYRLDINEYQGLRKLQLIVEHLLAEDQELALAFASPLAA